MKEIITKHFHIYQSKNHLICYFEIQMLNGEYILWEFLDHKLYKKNIWKI